MLQNSSSQSWSASGVANGTYKYRVRTCNTVTGCGSWSGTATETVAWVPATPTNFHHVTPPILVPPGNTYTLAWDSTSHATSYQLALDGTTATQTGITGTSQTETAPNSYQAEQDWRLRACGAGGCSAWTAMIAVHTPPSSGGGGGFLANSVTVSPGMTTQGTTVNSGGTGALVVATSYSTAGYPETMTRQSDGYVYMQVAAMDAWGRATTVYEGGTDGSAAAVTVTRKDNQATGLVTSIVAANDSTSTTLASYTSSWDGFGNLLQRTADGSTENATYDKLNRLTGSTTTLTGGGGTASDSYTYDKTGNRTEWDETDTSGVVTPHSYSYGGGSNGAGPHAVSAVNGVSSVYAYNADGEMTQDNDRTLTWSAFGKAESIAQSSTTVNFSYGPGNSRYQKVVTGPASETVTYLGGAEVLNVSGNTSIRRTLSFAGLAVIDTGGSHAGVHFAIPDHLGSTMALIDSSGAVTQGLSYGNFGKRYTTDWSSVLSSSQAWTVNTTLTDKGYTGQESLDSVGLDDYNARLYDPSLGRFLSTDPLIGHPGSTQSINPYSYVENNPLNKTDPTGESECQTEECPGMSGGVGSYTGPQEVKDAVHSEESLGKAFGGLSKAQGNAVLAKYGHGVYSSLGSFTKTLSNAAGWTNLNSSNASFNPNTHSQSSGSSGAGSPTTNYDGYYGLSKKGADSLTGSSAYQDGMSRSMGMGNYDSQLRTERALANGPMVLTQAQFNLFSEYGQLANVATKVGVFEGGLVADPVASLFWGVGKVGATGVETAQAVGRYAAEHSETIWRICFACLSSATFQAGSHGAEYTGAMMDTVVQQQRIEDIRSGIEAKEAGRVLQTKLPIDKP